MAEHYIPSNPFYSATVLHSAMEQYRPGSRNADAVEVGETEERLDVPNFLQLRPILYGLDLRLVHGESLGRENVSKVFDSFHMEFALVSVGE